MLGPRAALLRVALVAVGGIAAAWPQAAFAQALDEGVGSGVVTLDAWGWLNLVIRLLAVIGVIWAAFWGMRWYNHRVQGGSGASRTVQVLEARALGPNRSLQLVRVGRRAVLVGVTPERINQLLEIDDPEEVERLAESAIAGRETVPGLDRLAGMLSRIATAARSRRRPGPAAFGGEPSAAAVPFEANRVSRSQQLQANAAYRSARIAELQRAIEDARRGTILEDVR